MIKSFYNNTFYRVNEFLLLAFCWRMIAGRGDVLVSQVCLWTTRWFLQCPGSVCRRGRRRVCPVTSGPATLLCPTCRSWTRCVFSHKKRGASVFLCVSVASLTLTLEVYTMCLHDSSTVERSCAHHLFCFPAFR